MTINKEISVVQYDVEVRNPKWPKMREPRRSDVPVFIRGFEMLKKSNPVSCSHVR
jgi:hypothetical protein